jgi:hypothetical protein
MIIITNGISALRSFSVEFSDDLCITYVVCTAELSLGVPDFQMIWSTSSPVQSGRSGGIVLVLCNGITL